MKKLMQFPTSVLWVLLLLQIAMTVSMYFTLYKLETNKDCQCTKSWQKSVLVTCIFFLLVMHLAKLILPHFGLDIRSMLHGVSTILVLIVIFTAFSFTSFLRTEKCSCVDKMTLDALWVVEYSPVAMLVIVFVTMGILGK
jgi:predicted permease